MAKEMSQEKRLGYAVQELMEPGTKYSMGELIELLENSNFEFNSADLGRLHSEPHRERWNRTLRNAVRNSPDRKDHSGNWWTKLHASVDEENNWKYWI